MAVKRLLKYWHGPRVEAEGARRQGANEAHPQSGLQRASDAASRPFRLAPGRVAPNLGPARRVDLIGPGSHGYRRCARAWASAKFDSNADHVSISIVS